jgi:predicted  nucleic acid-binding Zn-ribbon protein
MTDNTRTKEQINDEIRQHDNARKKIVNEIDELQSKIRHLEIMYYTHSDEIYDLIDERIALKFNDVETA